MVDGSLEGHDIGHHDPLEPAKARIREKLAHGGFLAGMEKLKRSDSGINADAVAKTVAVSHSSGRAVYTYPYSIESMAFDTRLVELVRKASKPDRGGIEPGLFCAIQYSHIDLVRNLRRHSVERQGRDEAHDGLRDAGGEIRVTQFWKFRQSVHTSCYLLNPSGIPEPIERARMNPKRNGCGGAQHSPLFFENCVGCSPCLGMIHTG